MPVNDELGKRMKRYEAIPQISLMRRTPVAIRIDGKAHHTFTKHLQKPFDSIYQQAMQNTMFYLAKNIQNCIFGYQQSDEITLILTDYETLTTDAWFGYEVQKLCSISASMATMYFNQEFRRLTEEEIFLWGHSMVPQSVEFQKEIQEYHKVLRECVANGAMFDSRCFNIPKEEVTNLVYWRQLDAMRNSVLMVGQSKYSHRQLQGASCKVIKEMLRQDNYDWDKLPIYQQRGVCCYKTEDEGWYLDFKMPVLKDEGRDIIEELL